MCSTVGIDICIWVQIMNVAFDILGDFKKYSPHFDILAIAVEVL